LAAERLPQSEPAIHHPSRRPAAVHRKPPRISDGVRETSLTRRGRYADVSFHGLRGASPDPQHASDLIARTSPTRPSTDLGLRLTAGGHRPSSDIRPRTEKLPFEAHKQAFGDIQAWVQRTIDSLPNAMALDVGHRKAHGPL